jgi:hypothetical protein
MVFSTETTDIAGLIWVKATGLMVATASSGATTTTCLSVVTDSVELLAELEVLWVASDVLCVESADCGSADD